MLPFVVALPPVVMFVVWGDLLPIGCVWEVYLMSKFLCLNTGWDFFWASVWRLDLYISNSWRTLFCSSALEARLRKKDSSPKLGPSSMFVLKFLLIWFLLKVFEFEVNARKLQSVFLVFWTCWSSVFNDLDKASLVRSALPSICKVDYDYFLASISWFGRFCWMMLFLVDWYCMLLWSEFSSFSLPGYSKYLLLPNKPVCPWMDDFGRL